MNWIKVVDELPKDHTECWVYDGKMQEPEMSTFCEGVFYYYDHEWHDGDKYENITHWRYFVAPLPPEKSDK